MSATTEAVSAPAATKKATGGAKKATKKPAGSNAEHPKYSEMIKQALAALKERGGSSRQAVLKYIMANFNVGKDETSVNSHLKMALRAGVKNSSLKQSKGTGASGSFRLGAEATKKPTKKSSTTGAAKKAKKSTTSPAKKTKAVTKTSTTAGKAAKATKPKKDAVKKTGKAAPKSPKKVVKKTTTTTTKPTTATKKPPPAKKAASTKKAAKTTKTTTTKKTAAAKKA